MTRARAIIVVLIAGLLVLLAPSATLLAADQLAKVNEDITKAEEARSELERKRDDTQKKRDDNAADQGKTPAEDKDKLAKLKAEAGRIADQLNTINAQIAQKQSEIDGKVAELRTEARNEAKALVAAAKTKLAANNPAGAATDLRSAKQIVRTDWPNAMRRWNRYVHAESPLRKPPTAETRAVASGELARLDAGVTSLKTEQELAKAELADVDALLKENLNHDDWKGDKNGKNGLKEALQSFRKDVEGRVKDAETRIGALGKRREQITKYLEK
jgi:chromosome segregation ATPase